MRYFRYLLLLLLAVTVVFVAMACDDDDDANDDDDDDNKDDDSRTETESYIFNPDSLDWDWVPVDGAICRDGTRTGVGVRKNPHSRDLAIFLDGGGACATPDTCADAPDRFPEDLFDEYENDGTLSMAVFNATDERNPVRTFNFAYVPYCTGDMHMGSKYDGYVPMMHERQQFVGYRNAKLFIEAIAEQYAGKVDRVILMGMSAGGFGTYTTFPLVAEAFKGAELIMLSDSAPIPFTDRALAPCFQRAIRWLWDLAPAIPRDCESCEQPDGDGLGNLATALARKYPKARFGLFSTMSDLSIRGTFGPGQLNCVGFGTVLPTWVFRDALVDLRDRHLLPTGNWSTFYIEGENHGMLFYDYSPPAPYATNYFDAQFHGHYFIEWLAELLERVPPAVGPRN
jgi:Pectinacetylesterase